jgi:hypothetical protein
MAIRDKTKRFVRRMKEHIPRSSRDNTPEPSSAPLVDDHEPNNAPAPTTDPAAPAGNDGSLAPQNLLTGTVPTASSQPAIADPTILQPVTTEVNPNPPAHANLPDPAPTSSDLPSSKLNAKNTAWAGLTNLTDVLKANAGPIKSAVEAISGCVEVYEVRVLSNRTSNLIDQWVLFLRGRAKVALTMQISKPS